MTGTSTTSTDKAKSNTWRCESTPLNSRRRWSYSHTSADIWLSILWKLVNFTLYLIYAILYVPSQLFHWEVSLFYGYFSCTYFCKYFKLNVVFRLRTTVSKKTVFCFFLSLISMLLTQAFLIQNITFSFISNKQLSCTFFYYKLFSINSSDVCAGASVEVRDSDGLSRLPHLHQWFRTTLAVIMYLTNGTLQVRATTLTPLGCGSRANQML